MINNRIGKFVFATIVIIIASYNVARYYLYNDYCNDATVEYLVKHAETRSKLIADVNQLMTEEDKRFLVSFEKGEPQWDGYEFEYFKDYPSVKWKLINLAKLAKLKADGILTEEEFQSQKSKLLGL